VPDGEIKEVVADKGYHSNQVMVDLEAVGVRSYISEPDRGRRNWKDHPDARDAVYRNRRRIRGARGKRLLRQRGERLERPCAHLYETGRMRRVYLRGHDNIRKRLLVHAGGLNLGLLMRTLFGAGTPRGLQGCAAALFTTLWWLLWHPVTAYSLICGRHESQTTLVDLHKAPHVRGITVTVERAFATGC
jgi:transposase